MLAEADPEFRRALAAALRCEGYEVLEAADGQLLVRSIILSLERDGRVPELIISGVQMPGCTGLEVLARVRRIGWSTPFILLSERGEAGDYSEAERLGATFVLDKPLEAEQVACAALVLVEPEPALAPSVRAE
ncbi:response regulator [Aggregicoccus sp. 17bor-14]|uniref:response regulator transcription factor n=1 Tax=Myxococcaceae TaxID=31 RepID=UPI00129C7F9F|nr:MULTISPECIES: response regulator [Myxococcaceae]MBF5041788.1 response regulator [Simulacricoccus sp. 17bor-14]MRI87569.1 response regulator [Aggregicoccus sp. 17bor-14]